LENKKDFEFYQKSLEVFESMLKNLNLTSTVQQITLRELEEVNSIDFIQE